MTVPPKKENGRTPSKKSSQDKPPNSDSFAHHTEKMGDVTPLGPDNRRNPSQHRTSFTQKPSSQKPNPAPLNFPEEEEPLLARRSHVRRNRFKHLRAGKIRPQRELDLHGSERGLAKTLLISSIKDAAHSGVECILVIHGQGRHSEGGEAILRTALPSWLTNPELQEYVLAISPAQPEDGGRGAVYILLAQNQNPNLIK